MSTRYQSQTVIFFYLHVFVILTKCLSLILTLHPFPLCHFLLFTFYCFFLHFVLLRFLFPIFFLTCLQFSSLTNFIFLCDFQSVLRCLCLCLSTFLSLFFSLYVLYTSSLFPCPSCLFLIHVHSRLRPCRSPVRLHYCLSDSSLLYTFSLCLCLPFSLLSSHLTD